MSLGRLQLPNYTYTDTVVERVNELLAQFFLSFRPAPDSAAVEEATGERAWELVKVRPEESGLAGGTPAVTYRLCPEPDITAYDLARIQALAGFRLVQQPGGPDVGELLGDLERHFVRG